MLAPPGHGKTCFMRALAGRLYARRGESISGTVRYNGRTAAELLQQEGIRIDKVTSFAEQTDAHMPQLTARETLHFAAENCLPSSHVLRRLGVEQGTIDGFAKRAETIGDTLGLTECMDTAVGSDTVRGISGGQRKRVTIAEAMVPLPRLLFLDEPSTGLDAATTLKIIGMLRNWTRDSGGSAVISLLQPSPEVVALFDSVICLREGAIVYHGPPTLLASHFTGLGFVQPNGSEDAEFVVDVLTDPAGFSAAHGGLSAQPTSAGAPNSTAQLVAAWQSSKAGAATATAPQTDQKMPLNLSPLENYLYGRRYARSMLQHSASVMRRQALLVWRNFSFVWAHLLQAVVMGLLLGSLFYNPPFDRFNLKISVTLFAAFLLAFNNMPEVSIAVESRRVLAKHASLHLYPSLSYVVAVTLAHVPLCLAEVAILGSCVYTMIGFDSDPGRFAFFLLALFLCDLALSIYFRLVAYASPNADTAEVLAGPSAGIFILFSGFLATRLHIPDWLIWLYYISPFSWLVRSIAHNEFLVDSGPYSVPPTGSTDASQTYGIIFMNVFDIQLDPAWKWAGVGYIAGFGLVMLLLSALVISYCGVRFSLRGTARVQDSNSRTATAVAAAGPALTLRSANRSKIEEQQSGVVIVPMPVDHKVAAATPTSKAVNGSNSTNDGTNVLACAPTSIAFEGLLYTVKVPSAAPDLFTRVLRSVVQSVPCIPSALMCGRRSDGGMEDRVLLDGITAYALPNTLTAIVGASGAGKTTLLDVLTGMKNTGSVGGSILVNGAQIDRVAFAKVAGYVQQQDLHVPTATVREALEFSAALRLPATVTQPQRTQIVNDTIRVLELESIADQRIGSAEAASGLSGGQRKRVTIGVELVANPSIVFADEPTSGLDSRAALTVVRALRNIASTGRTVIATIHQPSSEVFAMFDSLLLLDTGGKQVYFGPVQAAGRQPEAPTDSVAEGDHHRSSDADDSGASSLAAGGVVGYFSGIPGITTLSRGKNPANWVLELLSDRSGISRDRAAADLKPHPRSGEGAGSILSATRPPHAAQPNRFAVAYQQSSLKGAADARISVIKADAAVAAARAHMEGNPPAASAGGRSTSFVSHMRLLLARAVQSQCRDVGYSGSRFVAMIVLALLFGALFWKIDQSYAGGIQTGMAVWWMSIAFVSLVGFSMVLPATMRARTVYYRETSCRMYSPEAFVLSHALVEIPFAIINTLVFAGIFYPMVGGIATGTAFFNYWVCLLTCTLAFHSMGVWFAALFPTVGLAQIVGYFSQAILFLFGGLFVPEPSIPTGWLFMMRINPLRYAAGPVWITQFYCYTPPFVMVDPCPTFEIPGLSIPVSRWAFVRDWLGLVYKTQWWHIGIVVCFYVAYTLLAMLTLRFVSHIKR